MVCEVVSRGLLMGWFVLCPWIGNGRVSRWNWLRGDVDGDIICGIGIERTWSQFSFLNSWLGVRGRKI